ncbi:hypothetical protein IE53DRAFT_411308 [Violaceomyces palustris]|uniref:Uncharacterized protein n=1 Tax=Violaceomyces palustris TaxID=1673888 RepID=A0ACD0NVI9_9BASI|nr:hypothetical protein IE53DRAFT_411308 [Violaceomyces palustris]
MSTPREFDVVLYGATGFTGKICAKYLSKHPQNPKWALAGRNSERLKDLRSKLDLGDHVGTIQANSFDPDSLDAMAKRVKVVINIVGPYRKNNAEAVVKACVQNGTSYVDLSGETAFNATLIEKYHLAAQAKQSIIAPSVGFDSLPFDVTTFLAAQHAKQSAGPGSEIESVSVAVVAKGGISSGTISSAIDMHLDKSQLSPGKPDWLSPVSGRHTSDWYGSKYFPQFKKYGAFSPFTPHNHRIVNRTWGLLEQHESKLRYGKHFQYDDGIIMPFRPLALLVSLFTRIFGWLIANVALVSSPLLLADVRFDPTASPDLTICYSLASRVRYCVSLTVDFNSIVLPPMKVRWLLTKTLPENGGPPENVLINGKIDARALAKTSGPESKRSICTMRAKGDPGYQLTARMIVETALTICLESHRLPEIATKGGVLTPALVGADLISERLTRFADFTIECTEFEDPKSK